MERWLSYDQISLIPTQVSSIGHRADVDTSVQFGPVKLQIPIIAAPMPDVSNGGMSFILNHIRSFGWIHRFQSLENMKKETLAIGQLMFHAPGWNPNVGIAIPLKNYEEIVDWFYPDFKIFCLDTANGASTMVQEAIGRLKDKYPDIFIVAGNVASTDMFCTLEDWGADAIRVGIAGGSVCETRTETGVYSPMATVVQDCARWKSHALLIADGGIKTPADMCKALAIGADVVMMGGALAGTKESPGDIIKLDGKLYKKLRGAASFGVQKEANGEDPNYVEGTETLVPYVGSVEKVINRFAAGLRSSMSYMNAKTLTEYKKNVKIVEVA